MMESESDSNGQRPVHRPYNEHCVVMKVKKTPISNVLMFHDTELDINEHNKVWIDYAKSKLESAIQECGLISKRHVQVGMAVKMFLLKKDLIIFYMKKNTVVPMKITLRNAGRIMAQDLLSHTEKPEVIKFENIATDPAMVKAYFKKHQKVHNLTGYEPNFYNVSEFREARNYAEIAVNQVVKPGMYFELQLEESPGVVVLARVLKNYRGFLLVVFGIEQRWVHMSDPLCHGCGWTNKESTMPYKCVAQQVNLIAGYTSGLLHEMRTDSVPSFVFRNNFVAAHRITEGDIVALADLKNRLFWYAHVESAAENVHHFFHLKIGHELVKHPKRTSSYYFHIYHPRIFSVDKIRATGLPIMLPENFNPNPNETDIAAYMRVFCPTGKILGENIGVDYHFQTTVIQQMPKSSVNAVYDRMRTLKYIEVLRTTSTGAEQITAAMVTGFKNDILRIRVPGDEWPIYLHVHDPKIFHIGACIDMNLAIYFDRLFMETKRRERKSGDEFCNDEKR